MSWTPVVVVNRYHLKSLQGIISVQRPTPLGNPWHAGRHGSRDEVVTMYASWLEEHYARRTGTVYEELARLARIEPLVISCTCLPRACHATVVAQFIERMRRDGIPAPAPAEGF